MHLLEELLVNVGFPRKAIHRAGYVDLPGGCRGPRTWDLVVNDGPHLFAALQVKSTAATRLVDDFGVRTEDALCRALDVWNTFRACFRS